MGTSIFISANPLVNAQYFRLESAIGNRLPRPGDMNREVREQVRIELSKLFRRVPWAQDESELTEEDVRFLCERFRNAVSLDVQENKSILTAGGVSFYFSSLVYYVLGRPERAPTPLQIKTLLDICDIADTRPLPVMRWTEFVRSNVSDAARIRTVMRSCIYSKTRQEERFARVVANLKQHILRGKENIRILAIGSSGTVVDALKGLRKLAQSEGVQIDVSLTLPTPGIVLNQSDLGFDFVRVDEKDLPTDADKVPFDLVIMGCQVIGETTDNEIEIVNWERDIDIANRMRRLGALLIVVGGLYKIWPQSFYQSHKEIAVNITKPTMAGLEATSILSERDIDWLVTEHEAVSFREPGRPSWLKFLFWAHSLDVTTGLSLFANEKSESEEAFIQNILRNAIIRDIDKTLGLLSGREPMAFNAFKFGFVLTIVGLAFWALFLVSNKMTLAFWASAIAAVGANIVMLGVLGGRRGAA